MIDRWKQWWRERSQREQWLLGVMLLAILAFFSWLLIWRPISSGLITSRTGYDRAVIDLANVKAKSDALKSLQAKPFVPLGVPITTFVTQSANEAGFTLSRADVLGSDGVAIEMVSAKSPALFAWFNELETRGLFVSEISITPNADMTIAVKAVIKVRAE